MPHKSLIIEVAIPMTSSLAGVFSEYDWEECVATAEEIAKEWPELVTVAYVTQKVRLDNAHETEHVRVVWENGKVVLDPDGTMTQRVLEAMGETWRTIHQDFADARAATGRSEEISEDEAAEIILDAGYIDLHGGDKQATEWFRKQPAGWRQLIAEQWAKGQM